MDGRERRNYRRAFREGHGWPRATQFPLRLGRRPWMAESDAILLLRAGYAYVPYSSLESVIEMSKERYYLALRQTQVTTVPNSLIGSRG